MVELKHPTMHLFRLYPSSRMGRQSFSSLANTFWQYFRLLTR